MSNAIGAVKFPDNTIMWCEYNGTVDVMIQFLYDTSEEAYDNWRNNKKWNIDPCPHGDEEVEIYSNYGKGFYWIGRACRLCKKITDQLSPDYDSEINCKGDWFHLEEENGN